MWACVRAVGSFLRRRPRVVVIVGGYASFPAGVAAVLTRVPLVSMTTDSVPGAVNGLLGRFAAANAVAFAGTDLPRTHVTGTPVRPQLAALQRDPEGRAASRVALGLPPERQTVACAGGSLGARQVNRAVADLADVWAAHSDRTLYHVTGRRDYDAFAPGSALGSAAASPAGGQRPAARRPLGRQRPRMTGTGSATGWCRSRTRCPTSTTRPTCASSGPGP